MSTTAIIIISTSVILLSTSACFWKTEKIPDKQIEETTFKPIYEHKTLAKGNNDFAIGLYRQMAEPDKNIFFSPLSIYTAFSMVYAGAKMSSEEEIKAVFGFDADNPKQHAIVKDLLDVLNNLKEGKNVDLAISNALFCGDEYEPILNNNFKEITKTKYDAPLFLVDYSKKQEAADKINTWVQNKTKDRIQKLVSPDNFDDETALTLLNAIFFKANWQKQFDPKVTRKDKFFFDPAKRSDPQSHASVDMMQITSSFPFAELPGLKIIELPYQEKDLAMTILLPDDISVLEGQLNSESMSTWFKAMQERKVNVFLPKFKQTITANKLVLALKSLGIVDAFDRQKANFRSMFDLKIGTNAYIQNVLHKAFIEVNEDGSEAAAATAVIMGITRSSVHREEIIPIFRADHPFVYMIRHLPSGTILFMGKIYDPSRDGN